MQIPAGGRFGRLAAIDPLPAGIWIDGEQPGSMVRCLGVWGTREPAATHSLACVELVGAASAAGWDCVVTGLSPGVDQLAAQAALDRGMGVVAVVAGGTDVSDGPGGPDLQRRIADGGGMLVSLESPGTPISPAGRLRRNEVQALVCDGAVIVASEPDGGAVHCGRLALHHGRPVATLDAALAPELPGCLVARSPVTAVASV